MQHHINNSVSVGGSANNSPIVTGRVTGDVNANNNKVASDVNAQGNVPIGNSVHNNFIEEQATTGKSTSSQPQAKNKKTFFADFLNIGQGVNFSIQTIVIVLAILAGIAPFVYEKIQSSGIPFIQPAQEETIQE
jgi:hypothetical protein